MNTLYQNIFPIPELTHYLFHWIFLMITNCQYFFHQSTAVPLFFGPPTSKPLYWKISFSPTWQAFQSIKPYFSCLTCLHFTISITIFQFELSGTTMRNHRKRTGLMIDSNWKPQSMPAERLIETLWPNSYFAVYAIL